MSNVLVTIIIPVYNVENYLQECLESIKIQKYQNLEVIAINDGSNDNSLEILNSYQEVFNKYRIITQENNGQGSARNTGMDYITGKYTYFLDSDDYILPETIMNLVNLAEEYDLDLVRFNGRSFVEEGFDFQANENQYNSKDYFTTRLLYDNERFVLINFNLQSTAFQTSVCLYFIKSSIIKENDLRFKHIIHEDRLFTVTLLNYCHRIMYDSTRYFQRRYRPNSTMTKNVRSNIRAFDSRIEMIHELESMQKKKVPGYYSDFLRKHSEAVYRRMFDYQIDRDYKKKQIKTLQKKYKFKSYIWINCKKLIRAILF